MGARQLELFRLGNPAAVDLPPRPPLQATDTVASALGPFTDYMRQRELAQNTIRSFVNDMRILVEYLGPGEILAQVSTARLRRFLHYLQDTRDAPCAPRSLERRITTLKVFFGWLTREGILRTDPAAPLTHEPVDARLPTILSRDQVGALLGITEGMRDAVEAPDARPHVLLTLLLATAIKKAECMRIKLEHIDLTDTERPSVYIHYAKPRQRLKARRLPLPPHWVATLEWYLRRYQPKERLFECTARNLEYVLRGLASLAGLREPLTFETLRWTSAVLSYREGLEHDRLRRRLGLSGISWRRVGMVLARLAAEQERAERLALPPETWPEPSTASSHVVESVRARSVD